LTLHHPREQPIVHNAVLGNRVSNHVDEFLEENKEYLDDSEAPDDYDDEEDSSSDENGEESKH
jgi:hypothetical protein